MKKAMILLGTISMSALLAGCSPHNPPPPDKAHSQEWASRQHEHMRMIAEYYFDQMDANHDGVVTQKEFMNFQHKKFKEIDSGNNGEFTLDEFLAQGKNEKHQIWDWMRAHHDENAPPYHDDRQDNDWSGGPQHSGMPPRPPGDDMTSPDDRQ